MSHRKACWRRARWRAQKVLLCIASPLSALERQVGRDDAFLVTGAVHTVTCLHSDRELNEKRVELLETVSEVFSRLLVAALAHLTPSTDLLAAARPLDPNRCAHRRACRPETAPPPQNQLRSSLWLSVRSAKTNSLVCCG